MDLQILLVFGATLFVVAITPGPAITALVSRTLGFGLQGTLTFVSGMLIGSMCLFILAILGLAKLASTYVLAFTIVKYAGAAYLLFLAWKLWRASGLQTAQATEGTAAITQNTKSSAKTLVSGMLITLSNPKGLLFYAALMPSVVPMETITTIGLVELMFVTLAVLSLVFAIYIGVTVRARSLLTSEKAVSRLNKSASVAMFGTAAAIVAR
ncbi:Homoserine/homoserine lactone efflux protein [Pseudovibrio sp. W64]|uniref:LysE family translocator n=1 Tax=unclassified Pseudovibrio TaxID=2627060 RepID=UPI0007AE9926|nr:MULTISPECIES: LysE family translocator [unclassified Pseudovibrio]KZK84368.1 Homoserine/homoserine lactone efflux protein [Pseudovibrio sp. W64]KZK87177.1 Homoserine/homoserine lactone efflux protein [Pseudovibrio sp. Ad13]KZL24740.1 Homoserine/homoserine lactone efflux protein [Pseudovibrio sp. WM33]